MIVNGKKIAKEILVETKHMSERLDTPPSVRFYAPLRSPETDSYLKIKKRSAAQSGCFFEESETPSFFAYDSVDAGIVQLPLPADLPTKVILDSIPLEKDADVLSERARALFEQGDQMALLPPVVAAVEEILKHLDINPNGKNVAVIGNGWLVGAPVASWFRQVGATVTILTKEESDFGLLKAADIIVSGAGSPHLVKPSMIKEGVVLIDAGTSESGGAIVGDIDPACESEVSAILTPVPGGVGPIAVACLFRNAAILATRRRGLQEA